MAEQCEQQLVDRETIADLSPGEESLAAYKKALLEGKSNQNVEPVPSDKRLVIPLHLSVLVEGRPDQVVDFQDVPTGKKQRVCLKEGATYKIKLTFYVQREIVSGLRYFQKVYRKGIKVDKFNFMVGSYGPKVEPQWFTTRPEEAPSGMLGRGKYDFKCKMTDDDKNVYGTVEWELDIAKDWED